MRPEAKLEKYFKEQADINDVFQCKFISGITGVPDRIIIGYGQTVFVELKAKNGKLSKRQKFVINIMRRYGAVVFVPFTENDIDAFFERLKNKTAVN